MKLGTQLYKLLPLGLASLWLPAVTWAQGCALCYSQAAGSGHRMIQALKSGILVLVIPPMLISVGIAWMAYKKRNEFNEESTEFSEGD